MFISFGGYRKHIYAALSADTTCQESQSVSVEDTSLFSSLWADSLLDTIYSWNSDSVSCCDLCLRAHLPPIQV